MTADPALAGAPRFARWFLPALLVSLTLPFFFSLPRLPHLPPAARAYWDAHWREAVQRKIDRPLLDMAAAYPADSNEAKRSFRLTVPLLARLSGLGYRATVALRYGAWLALPALLLLLARRAGLEPFSALCATLTVMGTTTGTCVWRDDCLWFDNVAHTFIAAAMVARPGWLVAALIVLGTFTDERVFVVLPLVVGWHLLAPGAAGRGLASARGVLLGAAVALALRLGLALGCGLTLPLVKVGTATIFVRNLRWAPVAWLAALEGGWLLVAAGVRASWHASRPTAAMLAGATAAPLAAAMLVEDFSRSCSYAFPAVLCALAILARGPEQHRLRWVCGAAAAVSLLMPNVLVAGFTQIEPALPWWRAEFVFFP